MYQTKAFTNDKRQRLVLKITEDMSPAEVTARINAFFASEGLCYYAITVPENDAE